MTRLPLVLVLVGCGTSEAPAKPGAGSGDSAAAALDTSPPSTDSGDAPSDTGTPTDSADTGTAPCTDGLSVHTDAGPVAPDTPVHVGDAPSLAGSITATLHLTNPCADELRFLGHPDDWLTGAAFALDTLPPVYLAPGETHTVQLAFTPGPTGDYSGTLTLPYDQEGSPFHATVTGTATAPVRLVAVGEGRRVSTTPDYGTTWSTDRWDTLEGHTNALQRGMCYGAGRFVAVGGSDGAYWWTSPDGDTWTDHAEAGGAIGDCAYGDGRFVAFAGDLLTSSDGLTWSVSPQPYVPSHLRAMAYGIDATGTPRFVAVGDSGRVAVTLDGTSWSSDAHPISTDVRHVDFGVGTAGAVWVAAGSSGTLATSPDGVSWTEQVVGTADWSGVVWGGDRFLAGSGSTLYSSPDGYVWSLVGASGVVPLAHIGHQWFGADGSALVRSLDAGTTWTELRPADGGPGYAAARFAVEPLP